MGFKSQPYDMRVTVSTPPAVEPVTLADLKAHLRISASSEDAYLTALITTARQLVEEWTRRKLISQTLTGWLDYPGLLTKWWEGTITAAQSALDPLRTIQLPWCPTVSVTDVALYSMSDEEFVVDASTYRVDVADDGFPARITLKETTVWPGGSYRNQNSLRVRWVAGYGPAASDVPSALVLAVKILAAYFYTNRGECSGADDCLKNCGAMPLIQTYRVLSV